jgi:hypothetical protein
LVELRQAILANLHGYDIAWKNNHGFTPHMTLDYVEPGQPMDSETMESVPVIFRAVYLCYGDERIRIPLGMHARRTKDRLGRVRGATMAQYAAEHRLGKYADVSRVDTSKLTGGRWVTISGRHVYIKEGKIVAGGWPGMTRDSGQIEKHKSMRAADPLTPSERQKHARDLRTLRSSIEDKEDRQTYANHARWLRQHRRGEKGAISHEHARVIRERIARMAEEKRHAAARDKDRSPPPSSERFGFTTSKCSTYVFKVGLWQTSCAKKKRLVIAGGKVYLMSWNDRENRFGVDAVSSGNSFSDRPSIGSSPLEFWQPDDTPYDWAKPGVQVYRGSHPGNAITSIHPAKDDKPSSDSGSKR